VSSELSLPHNLLQ